MAARAVAVLTYHNDNTRTGQNTNETVLKPANVNTGTFGKLFSHSVDGFVYAQPLILTNVAIPGKGIHNVVYVVTMHDSVYAFDADSNTGTNALPLWQVSFIDPANGITSVPATDVSCGDQTPQIGITSTPVIDPQSGTIYVEAKTREVTGSVTNYFHRLHALDVTTGEEKLGGPVTVQPTVSGTGDGDDGTGHITFDPLRQLNRPGLLLNNGVVYIAYASHCDVGPYHGWLIGFDAQTLRQTSAYITTPNGSDGGIWQAGCAPASDAGGNIYLGAGNGTFDPANDNYGDAFLKLSISSEVLSVADYFSPYNQAFLSSKDYDIGSGGVVLLPDAAGSENHPHLMLGVNKQGTLYLLDRDNLGQFNPISNSQIVQEFIGAMGSCWSTPAYFNNTLYFAGLRDALMAYPITNGLIVKTPVSQGSLIFGFPGATPVISAQGTNNAIVWLIQSDSYVINGPAVLRAYNATNLSTEIYNSSQNLTRDNPGPSVKFTVPTVANGKVYVGTQNAISIFGNGSFIATPTILPAAGLFTNSVSVSISDTTPGAAIYYTLDGTVPTTNSTPYAGPFVLTTTTDVRAKAFKPGAVDSLVASSGFLTRVSLGLGTGLVGEYFASHYPTNPFSGPASLVRTDAVVNFTWNGVQPSPGIGTVNYTIRWTGSLQAQFNDTYTFTTTARDGVRLWVNNQLLINNWFIEVPTPWSGSIALEAGKSYPIRMEFYTDIHGATAQLAWSTPGTASATIPQTQLYPVYNPPPVVFQSAGCLLTNGVLQMQLSGPLGSNYVLQATTDFTDWTTLSTNISFASPFNLSDPDATNFPSRFYRAFQQP